MLIVATIVLTSLALYSYKTNTDNKKNVALKDTTNTVSAIPNIDKDTDGDGIPDWKEVLYHLDPNSSDTDNDGTPDSTEIEQKLPILTSNTLSNGTKERAELTETAKFTQEVVANAILLDQQGGLNKNTIKNMSEVAAQSIQNKTYVSPFTLENLKLAKTTDDNLYQIPNKVTAVFLSTSKITLQDVPAMLKNYTMTKSDADMHKIELVRQEVNKVGNYYLSLEVPNTLSNEYLHVIKTLDVYGAIIDDLMGIQHNPVPAMGALTQYYNARKELVNAVLQLDLSAQKQGVTFTSQDPAYILITMLRK